MSSTYERIAMRVEGKVTYSTSFISEDNSIKVLIIF